MKYILKLIILLLALGVNAQIQLAQLDYLTLRDSIFKNIDKSLDSFSLSISKSGADVGGGIGADRAIYIIIPTADSIVRGVLSPTDWAKFNTKFTLPPLASGSILFSNGSTISQNNTNLFWDNTKLRLGLLTSTPNFTLHNTGSEGKSIKRINSGTSYTVVASDNVLHFVTGASGSIILPTAASSTGRTLTISNHSVALTTSIAYRTAAATKTTTIAVNAEITIMSDGTEWVLTSN